MGYNKKFSKKTKGGTRLLNPTEVAPVEVHRVAVSRSTIVPESPLRFIYKPSFWLQLVLLLIIVHMCQTFRFFNYRNVYYLYAIVLIFVINIINTDEVSDNVDSGGTQTDAEKKANTVKGFKKARDQNYKNEPYKINYTNPFITNLDNINFNFRAQYNLGDFKTYLFNKIDELLISKYISFYKVLSFNRNNLGNPLIIKQQFDINDNYTNIFLGLANNNTPSSGSNPKIDIEKTSNIKNNAIQNNDIYLNTKALILMRGNVLQIPALGVDPIKFKPIPTSTTAIDNKELYIQIYEKNDLNKYERKDNLTVIKDNLESTDRCTLIDTNLDARVQYVAHISYMNTNRNPSGQTIEETLADLKNIERDAHTKTSIEYRTAIYTLYNDLTYSPQESRDALPGKPGDPDTDSADTSALVLRNVNHLDQLYNIIKTPDLTDNDKVALYAKIRRSECEFYKTKKTDRNGEIYPYFPLIENNKYYPIDHAMFIGGVRRYIADAYPYLLIPVILIDKPNININKPLFYDNTKDVQKNRQQRNWLIKEYTKIIETQFKGHIFNINSFYRKYKFTRKDLIYNGLSDTIDYSSNGTKYTTLNDRLFTKLTDTRIGAGGVPLASTGSIFYTRNRNNQNDIAYNTYNDLNKSKNMKNQWGFNITIENITSAVDSENEELYRDTMPYLIIQYGRIEEVTDGKKTSLKLDDAKSCFTIINLSITNEKTLFYDRNKDSPFLYNKISDEVFNKTNEITIDKEEYTTKLNKIKEELLLSNNPDEYILKDIETKLKQYNSAYSSNKIFISENFVNTEFLYDYKIKMNMIVAKILDHYFRANLMSIQEWSFNFSKTSLINFDSLLRYGNKQKLILKNIPITNYNINKHFKDIYELRIHYRHFLLNIYKDLWFLKETTSKPEDYYSEYFIESNNKYYYFDSEKARTYDITFHKNIEKIINNTPIISTEKHLGNIKHFVKHLGIQENLVIEYDEKSTEFSKSNIKNIKTGSNISYRPTYKSSGNLSKGDLFLIHSSTKKLNRVEGLSSNTRKKLIKNFNKDKVDKYIKQIENNVLININENIEIKKGKYPYKKQDGTDIDINIKKITMPELYNRNFIYISEDSIKRHSDSYNYPNFIKIGKSVETINIGKTEEGYPLPNIRLIENECNEVINNNINNETNIFPVINAYSLDMHLDDAVQRTIGETFNKLKLIMLELPQDIDWGEKSNGNENEIIFNNLTDKIKDKYYKIFDYSHEFVHSSLLHENLVINKIIFDETTPTRFKIQINNDSRITTDPLLTTLFKNIQNSNIYEKYVSFHNVTYVGNDIEYSTEINYLLSKNTNSLIKQNSMYKIINMCKNVNIGADLNNYTIEFETYYNVYDPKSVTFTNGLFEITDIQQHYTLAIRKYTNKDKKKTIIHRDVNNYNINENICQYMENINKCFDDYKLESTKNENNINKNIWDVKSFYYGKNLIDFKISDIVNANSDSKKNTYMTRLIDNIIFNEVCKIHYNIPKKIGITVNSDTSIDTYLYGGELYIPYYKRNQPVSTININTDTNICIDYGSIVNANVVTVNPLAIYNISIATYKQYYYYYKNIFINILGLYDDINAECNNFIKLGKSVLNQEKSLNQSTKLTSLKKYIKIPLNLNKYLTFSDNYMLFIRKTKKY